MIPTQSKFSFPNSMQSTNTNTFPSNSIQSTSANTITNTFPSTQSVKLDNWIGYDLKTDSFVNMKDAGIIDPTKVTRTAIENAASVAGTILLTECTVVDKPEDKKQDDMMGGMGGMF
jgi:chaperonin GroEL (HSP60 family)